MIKSYRFCGNGAEHAKANVQSSEKESAQFMNDFALL